ncbi:MAG: hypothetical protein Q8Q09_27095 [Deltaproteobacteria bacterium]|nr:hypothetical protein [Deltaproteobacteria bacterium]
MNAATKHSTSTTSARSTQSMQVLSLVRVASTQRNRRASSVPARDHRGSALHTLVGFALGAMITLAVMLAHTLAPTLRALSTSTLLLPIACVIGACLVRTLERATTQRYRSSTA